MARCTTVTIDPNVRVGYNVTFAGYEDIRGPMPQVGELVLALEVESMVTWPAIVVELNDKFNLIYMAVAWREARNVWDSAGH